MSDDTTEVVPAAGSALIEEGDRALYAAAAEHFPVDAHQEDVRGGAKITYVPGEDIISRMNKVFVYGWESEVMEHGINADADECWVRERVTIWRKATLRTMVVDGDRTITTYTEQLVPIKREQFGSQKLKRSRSTGKVLDIGFDLKGAATDALKKTVSLLGVGLYLWNKEELALIAWAKKEMEQQERQQQQGQKGNDARQEPENGAQGRQGRFARPNRRDSQGQTQGRSQGQEEAPAEDGVLVINGVTMPEGFEQPFALMEQGKERNQCRAEQCGTVIDPNADYPVGNEQKKGGYVMKRSRDMCGTILCAPHAAQWHRATKMAKQTVAA